MNMPSCVMWRCVRLRASGACAHTADKTHSACETAGVQRGIQEGR